MGGGPWCFAQQLLILNTIIGNEHLHQEFLDYSPYWVRNYNLPFNCRFDDDVSAITANMGDLIELEEDEYGLMRRVK